MSAMWQSTRPMDARAFFPIPPELQTQIRVLSHDLQRAKINLASGRLKPEVYATLSQTLDARLRALEAQVQARLLEEARMGRAPMSWKPGKAS